MSTVREYARSRGVSKEIVLRQINQYQTELEGHVSIKGNAKILDEVAEKFLDEHRMSRTVIIEPTNEETEKKIQELENQLKQIQEKYQDALQKMADATLSKVEMIEELGKVKALLEVNEEKNKTNIERLEIKDEYIKQLQDINKRLSAENERLMNRGFFAKFFRR